MEKQAIAKYLDHTILKANATHEQIRTVCDEAKKYGTFSVCVNSVNTYFVHNELKGSDVKTCSVVGFPLGAMATAAKAFEATCAIEDGADEIDMVIDIAAAKMGHWQEVEDDIAAVHSACKDGNALLKVIIETCLLTDEEKVEACLCAKRAGAEYVKTSTGFSTGGATVEDIKLMRETVGPDIGVKASGGVRDYEAACAMIEAGASRIGTSNAVGICE